jgi:hypothetical protein
MNDQEQQPQHRNTLPMAAFEAPVFCQETTRQIHRESFAINLFNTSQFIPLEFARKKKPTGRKSERRKEKLPNQIRHDQNTAIAVGTWKKRNK